MSSVGGTGYLGLPGGVSEPGCDLPSSYPQSLGIMDVMCRHAVFLWQNCLATLQSDTIGGFVRRVTAETNTEVSSQASMCCPPLLLHSLSHYFSLLNARSFFASRCMGYHLYLNHMLIDTSIVTSMHIFHYLARATLVK